MSLEFFGQFLLRLGELDGAQLRQALDLMEEVNPTLGQLAVARGFADEADCRRVGDQQKRVDLPFGELAMQMGVLNAVELEELLAMQQERRVDLSSALVQLGLASEDRVALLRDQWKSEQADERSGDAALPEGLRGHAAAELSVHLFPRLCLRIARFECVLAPSRKLDDPPDGVLAASVALAGTRPLEITLVTDRAFAERLTAGLLGMQLDALANELSLEGVGEFLNVLMGNVVATLGGEVPDLRLAPPRFGVLPTSGFCFEAITEVAGRASLVLET